MKYIYIVYVFFFYIKLVIIFFIFVDEIHLFRYSHSKYMVHLIMLSSQKIGNLESYSRKYRLIKILSIMF